MVKSCATVKILMDQSMQESGIFFLPSGLEGRKLIASIYGDNPGLKAVKVGMSLSIDGVSWVTPSVDDSLNLVLATTQQEAEISLDISQDWTYAQFTLEDKVGMFSLGLEVAA